MQRTSIDGIEKYLGSGMIKGIGPHFAKKMVKAFGEDVFDVIEKSPERLRKLDGLGPKRVERPTRRPSERSWCSYSPTELARHELCASTKPMGPMPSPLISENPYRLALLKPIPLMSRSASSLGR